MTSPIVKVTLEELATVYDLEDMWDLLEIHAVGVHNHNVSIELQEDE